MVWYYQPSFDIEVKNNSENERACHPPEKIIQERKGLPPAFDARRKNNSGTIGSASRPPAGL
jgi:hypothetical protein